jgi:hypothetical protein
MHISECKCFKFRNKCTVFTRNAVATLPYFLCKVKKYVIKHPDCIKHPTEAPVSHTITLFPGVQDIFPEYSRLSIQDTVNACNSGQNVLSNTLWKSVCINALQRESFFWKTLLGNVLRREALWSRFCNCIYGENQFLCKLSVTVRGTKAVRELEIGSEGVVGEKRNQRVFGCLLCTEYSDLHKS